MKKLEGIREADLKWLRTASMDHFGHPPGMTWRTAEHAFERLLAKGLIEKRELPAFERGTSYFRAVITPAGRAALIVAGQLLAAKAAKHLKREDRKSIHDDTGHQGAGSEASAGHQRG